MRTMHPFVMNPRQGENSRIDLSFLLDPPAGKDGFITISDGHLAKPNGERLRLWGVNVTDWSPGSVIIPSRADAPVYAAVLARLGVNCVRLHFLDLDTPRGLIDPTRNDSQHLDPVQLDRLDYWIAQLKKRGIYCDLNLSVGRSYKSGDNVQGYDRIGWAKAVSYFDPRLIELHKGYAEQLLTHYNPYIETDYRGEPAIAIIELVNENSLIEAWCWGALRRAGSDPPGRGLEPLPAHYIHLLDRMYENYVARLPGDVLSGVRAGTGTEDVPRLNPEEFATASDDRFNAEAAFYMEVERAYFLEMKQFLKEHLGVQSLLIGSNDHMHSQSGYPMIWSNSVLDIIDGHMYWQHPAHGSGQNTPMVNDPLHSMVVRLSRTAVAGKPFTVSETNHIFPGDWISEGIPILAAYGALQDWDGIIWYTFEPKADPDWQAYVRDAFDLSLDPVRSPQLVAGALMFLRGDVSGAVETIERSYTPEQVRESLRMPPTEKPFYTPGFPLSLPLRHKMRIGSLEAFARESNPLWSQIASVTAEETNPIVSDTAELGWYRSPEGNGLVTIDAPRSQALVGFVKAKGRSTRNLAAGVANEFCAITLSALDEEPIASSSTLLLTVGARVENTGQQWNDSRTEVTRFGGPPSLIEPVSGRIELVRLEGAISVLVQPLDGAGHPTGDALPVERTHEGWAFTLGDPPTTWYEIRVER
jgi:hypothetical protein